MNLNPLQPMPTWSRAELRRHFGMIPAERILGTPPPGGATESDAVRMNECGERRCELVDGTLIGKTMGTRESFVALLLARELLNFAEKEDLGVVLGADGMLRLQPGLIRVSDVSFISWERLPGGELPNEPVASISPDLAVEVIGTANTKQEMKRKLGEYFSRDVRLVWLVYPVSQSIEAYTSRTKKRVILADQTLDGGEVLPGFTLQLKQLFAPLQRRRRSK